ERLRPLACAGRAEHRPRAAAAPAPWRQQAEAEAAPARVRGILPTAAAAAASGYATVHEFRSAASASQPTAPHPAYPPAPLGIDHTPAPPAHAHPWRHVPASAT